MKQLHGNNFFSKSVQILLYTILILNYSIVKAQVVNNGNLFIDSNAVMNINSDQFIFKNNASTITTKSNLFNVTDGKIMLNDNTSFITDGNFLKYVNGYAGTYSANETLLAIGDDAIYAPVKVTSNTNTNGVQAAFFNTSPFTIYSNSLDASVSEMADDEFWIIKGDNAIISLNYRSSSNLTNYISDLQNITILGYNTLNQKWDVIESSVEVGSSSAEGYVTSLNEINLSNYEAFTLGLKIVLSTTDFTKNFFNAFISDDYLNITSNHEIKKVEVYDISGKLIFVEHANNQLVIRYLFDKPVGFYIIKIMLSNFDVVSHKLIKLN